MYCCSYVVNGYGTGSCPLPVFGISGCEPWDFATRAMVNLKLSCMSVFCKKCTLVQALRLCTGHTAHKESRGIALPFHDHGTRRGWAVTITPRPLFTPGKDPVPIVQEAGWDPGPVWTGVENLTPTGIRSPDCPARSQSLYRLRYLAHSMCCSSTIILKTDVV